MEGAPGEFAVAARERVPSCFYPEDLNPPSVFVSSTFDPSLKEVRSRLQQGIRSTGYSPLMSEFVGFGYAHDRRVFDETIAAVASAQICVLLIGGRYGTEHPDKGRSITELEYEEARRVRIPIFVYVQRSVWEGFQAWRSMDLESHLATHWVDDPKVFDFLERIAYEESSRCVSFESSEAVFDDIKEQMANLLGAYLRFQAKAPDWIWTERFTQEVERKADLVWVLTPSFYWDYADPVFRDLVTRNVVERKTRYVYLYRGTDDNDRRISEMTEEYRSRMGDEWRNRVLFAPIPPEEFNWCCEQVLYDPGDPARERGIMVDTMDGRDKKHKFDIEVGRERRSDLKGQFARLWAKHAPGVELPRLGQAPVVR